MLSRQNIIEAKGCRNKKREGAYLLFFYEQILRNYWPSQLRRI
jgi:hypothetical protein